MPDENEEPKSEVTNLAPEGRTMVVSNVTQEEMVIHAEAVKSLKPKPELVVKEEPQVLL